MATPLRQASIFLLLFVFLLGTVNAQEWDDARIRSVAAALHTDLSDPFEKVQLASDIRRYFEWRVSLSPNEYERDREFQGRFKMAFSSFAGALFTKDLKGAEQRLQAQTIKQMTLSYRTNRERFSNFYQRMGAQNPYYKKMSVEQMERKLIQFAVILNEAGDSVLPEVLKFTGIFPFC